MALVIDFLGGTMPCQAEGTADGKPFYFRSKHGDWRFVIADAGINPVLAEANQPGVLHFVTGDDPSCGAMPYDIAAGIIAREWLRWRGHH